MNAIDRKLEILAKCIGALSGELNAVNLENEILKSLFLDLIARKHPDMKEKTTEYSNESEIHAVLNLKNVEMLFEKFQKNPPKNSGLN